MFFPSFRKNGVDVMSGKKLSNELQDKKTAWLYSDNDIYIRISEKMSKTKLLEVITDKTPQVEKLMANFKEVITPKIKIRKVKI